MRKHIYSFLLFTLLASLFTLLNSCSGCKGEDGVAGDSVVSSIVDSPEFMQRVKDLGGTNTFQDFTRAEMREMMDRVDEQCKSFFGS